MHHSRLPGSCGILALCWGAAIAAPFTPDSDAQILVDIPATAQALATTPITDSTSPQQRLSEAQRLLQLGYATNDPRAFGYAEALLAPWWDQPDAPPQAALLQATIEQHAHRFDAAIATLTRVLTRFPALAQARLVRAQAYLAGARYEEALQDCNTLARQLPAALAGNCMAQVLSLTGHTQDALDLLDQIQRMQPQMSAAEQLEFTITRAVIHEGLGHADQAERLFQQGLTQEPNSLYLLLHYADLLLHEQRADAALSAIETVPREQWSQEVEVLRVEALQQSQSSLLAGERARVKALLEAAMRRGEAQPYKEHARFALNVLNDPTAALESALANWAYQKSPDDALLVLRAALAADDAAAIANISRWIETTALEDVRLRALLETAP